LKKQELVIEIGLDGKLSGDVIAGPGGKGCLDMLESILGGIGSKVEQTNKPEMFQAVVSGQAKQQIKR
jgi:hypothetical protein